MSSVELLASDPEALDRAIEALGDGWVVAVPTDTVYGLAVDPSNVGAVERLFAVKQRPTDVALPVLVGDLGQLDSVTGPLTGAAAHLARRYWPGPLTLVVPRHPGFIADLGGPTAARRTVGVRLPDHALLRDLCRRTGPLAVSSANLHGRPPASSAGQVADAFVGSEHVAVILDGGPCQGVPSTVVECRGPASRCLREGALPWSELAEGSDRSGFRSDG